MKIAVFSTKSYDREYLDEANQKYNYELYYFEPKLRKRTVGLINEQYDAVCVFVNDTVCKDVIKALSEKNIKLIALRCAGFNNVDIEAANQHGIRVLRVPAYSPYAVAEHAAALILTLNRKTHKAYNRVREGNFSLERLVGFDLHGKTVGVIGTGKIGQKFCSIMQGFGCKVIAYDKFPSDKVREQGVTYVNLKELYNSSDIISLHCPLTPETKNIINKESIKEMKDNVMLINTSRGKLIDTQSVIEGLKNRKIGYLGIDVYEQEENLFFKDLSEMVIQDDMIARIMTFPNALVTAHQAFFTHNALTQIAATTLKNATDFINDNHSDNEVTPEMVK